MSPCCDERGNGFEHEIEPFGMARLGGIDFDEAIFHHVTRQLPPEQLQAARTSPEGSAAVANMRRQCVDAKMSLSSDPAADVPVLLPGYTGTIRVTRPEFEDMIRPMIDQTVEGVSDMLRRANLDASDLDAVLLVGGSSRIPLVSEMVAGRLGVPVRVDAHPKLVVAKGAARQAAAGIGRRPPGRRHRAPATGEDTDDSDHRRRPLLIAAAVAVLA